MPDLKSKGVVDSSIINDVIVKNDGRNNWALFGLEMGFFIAFVIVIIYGMMTNTYIIVALGFAGIVGFGAYISGSLSRRHSKKVQSIIKRSTNLLEVMKKQYEIDSKDVKLKAQIDALEKQLADNQAALDAAKNKTWKEKLLGKTRTSTSKEEAERIKQLIDIVQQHSQDENQGGKN